MANVQVIPRFRPLNKREKSGTQPPDSPCPTRPAQSQRAAVDSISFPFRCHLETGGSQIVVDFDNDHKGMTVWTENGKKPNIFTFDHVFSPTSTQVRALSRSRMPCISAATGEVLCAPVYPACMATVVRYVPQAEVFRVAAEPLVKEIFNGYNTTIFA